MGRQTNHCYCGAPMTENEFCTRSQVHIHNCKLPHLSIENTLTARGHRYGSLSENAYISQRIKIIYRQSHVWDKLSYDKKEALDQIASKIGRMITGDPNYKDNWHDIVGYAKLVDDTLTEETHNEKIGNDSPNRRNAIPEFLTSSECGEAKDVQLEQLHQQGIKAQINQTRTDDYTGF